MMLFRKPIPRRTFLRGVGATVALPLLDVMTPVFGITDSNEKPIRLSYYRSTEWHHDGPMDPIK